MNFSDYNLGNFFDELFERAGKPRAGATLLVDMIDSLGDRELMRRQKAAEAMLLQMGITFAVYGNEEGTEKIFPFDWCGTATASSMCWRTT